MIFALSNNSSRDDSHLSSQAVECLRGFPSYIRLDERTNENASDADRNDMTVTHIAVSRSVGSRADSEDEHDQGYPSSVYLPSDLPEYDPSQLCTPFLGYRDCF